MMDAEFVVFKYCLRGVIEISDAAQAVMLRCSFLCVSRNAGMSVLDINENRHYSCYYYCALRTDFTYSPDSDIVL